VSLRTSDHKSSGVDSEAGQLLVVPNSMLTNINSGLNETYHSPSIRVCKYKSSYFFCKSLFVDTKDQLNPVCVCVCACVHVFLAELNYLYDSLVLVFSFVRRTPSQSVVCKNIEGNKLRRCIGRKLCGF